jgi:orotidine-5'-phosphate decarboxylase
MNWQAAAIKPGERIIVALDVPNSDGALALVRQLSPHPGLFKIGLQLYTAAGPEIVRAVRDQAAAFFSTLNCTTFPTRWVGRSKAPVR